MITIKNIETKEEYKQAQNLYKQFFSENSNSSYTNRFIINGFSRKVMRDIKDTKSREFFVAIDEDANKILGFIRIRTWLDDEGHISHFFITPNFRNKSVKTMEGNKKIALLLYKRAIEYFNENSINTVTTSVSEDNKKMQSALNRVGFEVVNPNQGILYSAKTPTLVEKLEPMIERQK